jgi:hypothetical protein
MELLRLGFEEKRLDKGSDDFGDKREVQEIAVNVEDGFLEQELLKFGAELIDETLS